MAQPTPPVCQLSHAGFHMLGEPVFRFSAGSRVPSMVVQFNGHETILPLKSVAREFGVDAESLDGQMLKLIEQALKFVVSLRLGDKLPAELYGGKASWEPTEQDQRTATSQVRLNLIRCVFARLGKTVAVKGGTAPGWEDVPENDLLLQQAITGSASLIEELDEEAVVAGVIALNEEMACIGNMRRNFTKGMISIRTKLLQIPQTEMLRRHQFDRSIDEKLVRVLPTEAPSERYHTVEQVQMLARRGFAQHSARSDAVDSRLNDVLALLRDMPTAIAWLRQEREWLVRTNYAWSAVFDDWAKAPPQFDEFLWKVIERTYQFLAPRFMSPSEWTVRDGPQKQEKSRAVVW